MLGENRGLILTILIIIAISITALIGVIYSFLSTVHAIKVSDMQTEEFTPDREVKVIDRQFDYNFAIPKIESQTTEPKEQANQASEEETMQVYNYNFAIPEKKNSPIKSMQIPKIGLDSQVYGGVDAVSAVSKGIWNYPSSHPLEGESIFLCHRRYFKKGNPKSCWYLDKLQKGDDLFINLENGTQLNYKIKFVNINLAEDTNIYNFSKDKIIKLISCSIVNGKIGGDTHRIIIIAELI